MTSRLKLPGLKAIQLPVVGSGIFGDVSMKWMGDMWMCVRKGFLYMHLGKFHFAGRSESAAGLFRR